MARKPRNLHHLPPEKAVIHAVSHEGRGIASLNQKTVFIDNALVNETVVFSYTKKSRRFDEGMAFEIENPSPDRITPKCQHFTVCGGCVLQHMQPTAQIVLKEKVLLENLSHFGKVIPETVLAPITGPEFGYRRKARLGVRYVAKKDGVLVGFREKNSNKLALLEGCEVLHPSVGQKITALKTLIQTLEGFDSIPQIEVAIGDSETALVFRHLKPLSLQDQQTLIEFAEQNTLLIYLQPEGPESISLLWPKRDNDYLQYELPDYSLVFNFKPEDFTQVNRDINQLMVKQALSLLHPIESDIILDLFCGLGNFTLPLARFAKQVVGIEGSAKMTERALYNAKQNNITNVDFLAANLEEGFKNSVEILTQVNKVLLDPPRTGAYKIVEELATLKTIEKIVYVSCNPATLARDLGILVKGGFCLKSVQVLDMFPHTAHIESIALLERSQKRKKML